MPASRSWRSSPGCDGLSRAAHSRAGFLIQEISEHYIEVRAQYIM